MPYQRREAYPYQRDPENRFIKSLLLSGHPTPLIHNAMHLIQRYRLVVHPLIIVLALGSCISIGVFGSSIGFETSDLVLMGVNGFVALVSIASILVSVWRKNTILSNFWLELVWLSCLIALFAYGSHEYYLFDLAPYISNFQFFTLVVSWVLQTLAGAITFGLVVMLVKLSWGLTPSRRDGSSFDHSGIHAIIGTPRSLEERKTLLHDTIGGFIFRHTLFRKQRYEPASIALIRGSIAFLAMAFIVLYGLDLLVVAPIVESAFFPVRSSSSLPSWRAVQQPGAGGRSHALFLRPVLSDLAFVFGQMNYTVDSTASSPPNSYDPLSPSDFVPTPLGTNISISWVTPDGSTFSCPQTMVPWDWDISLPGVGDPKELYILVNCSQPLLQAPAEFIQIVVDFSNIPEQSLWNNINFYTIQASAFPLPNSVRTFMDTVIQYLSTFPMVVGARLRGTTVLGSRRIIQKSWKDVIGVGAVSRFLSRSNIEFIFPQNYNNFNTYTHNNLIPDDSSQANYPGNVSTLLLTSAVDFSDFVTEEDYRQHTLISALASLGGFFTIIDGVFAMVFATTLSKVLFGSKMISPFGILGLILGEKLRRAMDDQYPLLRSQVREGGMATFLSDNVLDLSILEDGSSPGEPSSSRYRESSAVLPPRFQHMDSQGEQSASDSQSIREIKSC
ncbi:hypothetical protein JAAARDRAFT_52234 [Jaapia argillacea MUCL 33604]|uniref:Uncharacterized protein n=1 Tax=Jaapia argillacea MUCL 33604 TaxID=933084 RepID=A0A067QB19_9AGAM|nr:hypothetical protein JAAARDRAFT_52234 [Jaapia argillacea MUCL 33604]